MVNSHQRLNLRSLAVSGEKLTVRVHWKKSAQLCITCQRLAVSVKMYNSGSVGSMVYKCFQYTVNKMNNYVYAQLQLKKMQIAFLNAQGIHEDSI